ncbi:adenylate/guanylate cyclase domain-containing protein [Celeribacter sp.]|uniref:adenylate/guanylate cyclase domain-containing protein n=1 Tax=Celeribacter sp. TaxID=1890673 RepID=UPI003A8E2BB1
MGISEDVKLDVQKIKDATMSVRNGQVVPSTDSIALHNGAVELEVAYLYADLASSSKMARSFDRRITAKILKSFLATSARIIRHKGGTVMSFDGDRVMAAFVGNAKCTNATKAAFAIAWSVSEVIRPEFENKYASVRDADFQIAHAAGIDVGTAYIVRAGARGTNDLVSIGRAPNLAAKFSDIRSDGNTTFASGSAYSKMNADCKKYLERDNNPWTKATWEFLGESVTYYRTSYWRKPNL